MGIGVKLHCPGRTLAELPGDSALDRGGQIATVDLADQARGKPRGRCFQARK